MQFNLRQIDFISLNSIDKGGNLSFLKGFLIGFFAFFLLTMPSYAASPDMKRIVALGDSLTSGYGLESGDSFPAQLEKLLIADGFNVVIDNAGVSGDTTAGGLARVEWAIDGDVTPSLVIVTLGANDMLRGTV